MRLQLADIGHGIVDLHHHQRHGRVGFEGRFPTDGLEKGHPQRVDITALVDLLAFDLLRRHILRRANDRPGGRVLAPADHAGDAFREGIEHRLDGDALLL